MDEFESSIKNNKEFTKAHPEIKNAFESWLENARMIIEEFDDVRDGPDAELKIFDNGNALDAAVTRDNSRARVDHDGNPRDYSNSVAIYVPTANKIYINTSKGGLNPAIIIHEMEHAVHANYLDAHTRPWLENRLEINKERIRIEILREEGLYEAWVRNKKDTLIPAHVEARIRNAERKRYAELVEELLKDYGNQASLPGNI